MIKFKNQLKNDLMRDINNSELKKLKIRVKNEISTNILSLKGQHCTCRLINRNLGRIG